MALRIRPAAAEDAAALAGLMNELNVHEGKPPDAHSAATVLQDGFGPDPAFRALLAVRDGRPVGYACYFPAYNTDLAARGLWLADLYVTDGERRRGTGRLLLASVAAEAVRTGRASVEWTARSANARARAFYAAIGARDEDLRLLELDGEPLQRLAALARE
jgi:GNAT superfamily N-acetyltransferase